MNSNCDILKTGYFYEQNKLVVYKTFWANGKAITIVYREGKEPEEAE